MKRFLLTAACLLCICTAAIAGSFDPVSYAQNSLTEVYGYTNDEADHFIFDDHSAGVIRFYDADHPNWIYTLTYNADNWLDMQTPFRSLYEAYPGEGAVRDMLRAAKEEHWFTEWTPENRIALRNSMADLYDIHIRRAFENLLGSDQADPAQVINEFFICCYGEESGWPAALTEWRNEVLIDYGLSIDLIGDAPEAGSNRYSIDKGMYLQQTDVCEFKGEVSDELIVVFSSEPDLSGWNCTCGAVKSTNGGHSGGVELIGMAVFEKNGTRILVLMDRQKEQWNLWTLGTKALYQDPEMELSVLSDPSYASGFIIRYDCLDGIRMFHAGINDPTDDLRGHFALSDISGYQYVSADRQISHWINIDSNSGLWTYTQQGTDIQKESLEVAFSRWLGACDIAEFPDTAEKAHAVPEILPDGYAMTGNVHFRKDHSSRSKDLGTLQSGTIIRIKDTVPGDPFDWIQTSAGGKEGYVASNYTSAGSDSLHINTEYPLPVAMCRNTVRLRTGTGLFDAVADELPAGTKMHIIMNQGDWLYVVVPRGTISWFMDVDGIYGYIKKSDVRIAAMESCLDWQ